MGAEKVQVACRIKKYGDKSVLVSYGKRDISLPRSQVHLVCTDALYRSVIEVPKWLARNERML